jgi:uncharacterized membrane protein YbhN (UPF0104 family)
LLYYGLLAGCTQGSAGLELVCRADAWHNRAKRKTTVESNSPHFVAWKRWAIAATKLLIVLVVVWFIRRTIVDAWEQLRERECSFDLRWLAFSGVLYLLGTFSCGVFWHQTLLALGQPVRFGTAIQAYFVGHLGKYVPGKAMVVILRTGLVSGDEVRPALAAASVFFETLTMMASGACFSAAVIAIQFREQTLWFWAAIALMLLSGIPTFPPLFRKVVRWIESRKNKDLGDDALAGLGYRLTLTGWAMTLVGWMFMGASLWAVLRALGAPDVAFAPQWHLYTASVSLATVAGFVSFVPGGAGVREAAMAESLHLMSPQLGGGLSLLAAILLRLVWLVAELLISGILYIAARRTSSRL